MKRLFAYVVLPTFPQPYETHRHGCVGRGHILKCRIYKFNNLYNLLAQGRSANSGEIGDWLMKMATESKRFVHSRCGNSTDGSGFLVTILSLIIV